jgi:cyanophycinase
MTDTNGTFVLIGSQAARDEHLARRLLELAPGSRVAVVPLAAAFGSPEQEVVAAAGWLNAAGAEVEGVMAMNRVEADTEALAARVADADVAFLVDGSAMHLRTAIKATHLLSEIEALLARGGVVAAEGSSATVLCDPMVDPRGGAPTVGLGLLHGVTVISHIAGESDETATDKLERTASLVPPELPVLGLAADAAVLIDADRRLRVLGAGVVSVLRSGVEVDPEGLQLDR